MHILIAPNAFKNSITAEDAAAAIQKGLTESGLPCSTECFPVADGGDGTDVLLVKKRNGHFVHVTVSDPLGRKISAQYGLIDEGKTAVIALASASGLSLLSPTELDPLKATTHGTGELMLDALNKGVRNFIIAVGGSATVDGGMGLLSVMGIRFLDSDGNTLTSPESLIQLHSIDTVGMDARLIDTTITVLCDVDNRLLGEKGAAAVFGPQKGASPEAVKKLDAALEKFTVVVKQTHGKDISDLPYGGAAGGTAAGLWALLHATLVNGATHFLALTNFDKSLATAAIVITGEGSLDEQTLHGKAPFRVAALAKEKQCRVIGVAGNIPGNAREELNKWFDELRLINPPNTDRATALASAAKNLQQTGKIIGQDLLREH